MTVADRIKEKRIELGLSQSDLAQKIGNKDRSTICQIENSGDNITMKNIIRVAEAMNVTPQYLLGWSEEGFDAVVRKVPSKPDDRTREALELYEKYLNAIPEIQSAVESLLKGSRHDS